MKNPSQDKLAAHIASAVAAWPPLTREQLDRVATLLRPGGSTA